MGLFVGFERVTEEGGEESPYAVGTPVNPGSRYDLRDLSYNHFLSWHKKCHDSLPTVKQCIFAFMNSIGSEEWRLGCADQMISIPSKFFAIHTEI